MFESSVEKVGDLDILFKAMLGSEDYSQKRGYVEKKLRRVAQIKSDCNKYEEDLEVITPIVEKYRGVDVDQEPDVGKLIQIVRDSEKANKLLVQDVKELDDLEASFGKKRTKILDAEVRRVAGLRKEELFTVGEDLEGEGKKLQEFELAV